MGYRSPSIFGERRAEQDKKEEALKAQLYQQIGQLKVELDWLKKKQDLPVEAKRSLVEPGHERISLVRQCDLLGLSRSSLYYQPAGESAQNLALMRLLDEQYTKTPFYGSPRITRARTGTRLAAESGLGGQPQAGGAADAGNEAGGDLPEAQDERGCAGTSGLSLPVAGGDH